MKKENKNNQKNSMQYLLEEDLSKCNEDDLTDILEIIKKEQPDYIKIRTAIHFSKDKEEAYEKLKRLKKNIEVFEQNKEILDKYKNTINNLSKSLKEIKEVILLFSDEGRIAINNEMNDEDIFWLDKKGTLTLYTEEKGYVYKNIINDKVDYRKQFFSIQQSLFGDDNIHDINEEQAMAIEQRVNVFCGCINELIKNNELNKKQTNRLNNLKQDIRTAFETIKDRHIGISADNTKLFLRCNEGIKIIDLKEINNNNNKYNELIKNIRENILLGKIYDVLINRSKFTSKAKQKEILEDFIKKMNKLTENKEIKEIFDDNQLETVKKMFNQIKCTMEVINNNNFIIDEDRENIYFRNGKRKTVGNETLLGPDNRCIDAYKIPLYQTNIEQLAKAIGRKILLKTGNDGITYFKNRYRRSCGSSQDKMNNFNEIIVLEKQQLQKDMEQLPMRNNNSKNEDNNELNKNDNKTEQIIQQLEQKIEWLNKLQTKVKEYIVCDAAYQKLHTEKHKAVSLIRKNRIRNKMEYVVKMRENDGIQYDTKDLKEIEKHTPNGIEVLAGKYNEKWCR